MVSSWRYKHRRRDDSGRWNLASELKMLGRTPYIFKMTSTTLSTYHSCLTFEVYSRTYFCYSRMLRRTPDIFGTTSTTLSTYHFHLTSKLDHGVLLLKRNNEEDAMCRICHP